MALKKPKKKGGIKKKPTVPQSAQREVRQEDRNDDSDDEQAESISDDEVSFTIQYCTLAYAILFCI